jgi:phosphorylcholine metabolism protein LicD
MKREPLVLLAAVVVLVTAAALAAVLFRARKVSLYLAHLGLRELMRDFDRICTAHGVVYWADGGTLLGAVRDAGIIAHDDDIDVCVPAHHVPALLAAVAGTAVYHVRDTKFCLKFERHDVPEVWIDVFPVARDGRRVAYTNAHARDLWPNSFYLATELLPLSRMPFDSCHVWAPRDPAPYLERMYGDWRVPVVYPRH